MWNLLDESAKLDLYTMSNLQPSSVVVVYVWRSTTLLDRRRTKADYEHYAWNDQDSRSLFRSVGHAGIGIKYKGEFIYRGFGPLQIYKDLQLLNPAASFKAAFSTYEEDVKSMKSLPECKVYLHNLDFERLYTFLATPAGAWTTYNLYTKNCSTFVINALKIGSKNAKIGLWKKTKQFWHGTLDILNAFSWLFPNIGTQQRKFAAQMMAFDSNPVVAMDHLFKALGGDTPDAVLRYAHFLASHPPTKQ